MNACLSLDAAALDLDGIRRFLDGHWGQGIVKAMHCRYDPAGRRPRLRMARGAAPPRCGSLDRTLIANRAGFMQRHFPVGHRR